MTDRFAHNIFSQTISCQYKTPFSPYRAGAFYESCKAIKKLGFGGIELAVADPKAVNAAVLKKRLKDIGLQVTTISTGQAYTLQRIFLASPDGKIAEKAVEYIKRHCELAAELGHCPVTVGHIRGRMESYDRAEMLRTLMDRMDLCARFAEQHGVKLQIEAINHKETVLLNTAQEVQRFLCAMGNPKSIGILYDTYHSHIEGEDPQEVLPRIAHLLTNVHLADYPGRGLPGSGAIDFQRIMALLLHLGYRGAFALETLPLPSAGHVKEHAFRSIVNIFDPHSDRYSFEQNE